jgi:hypothetical protein
MWVGLLIRNENGDGERRLLNWQFASDSDLFEHFSLIFQ